MTEHEWRRDDGSEVRVDAQCAGCGFKVKGAPLDMLKGECFAPRRRTAGTKEAETCRRLAGQYSSAWQYGPLVANSLTFYAAHLDEQEATP